MTAWWMLPVYFALIAAAINVVEDWWQRRLRRERRAGRREALAWTARRDSTRSPW